MSMCEQTLSKSSSTTAILLESSHDYALQSQSCEM